MNGAFNMKWFRYPCTVQGEYIGPAFIAGDQMLGPQNRYSLHKEHKEIYIDSKPLYLDFIGIDEKNHNCIAEFISKHGPLGIKKKLKFNYEDSILWIRKDELLEEITVIQNEIILIRQIIELRDLYTDPCNNIKTLETELINLANILENNNLIPILTKEKDSNLSQALLNICDEEAYNKKNKVAKGNLTYNEILLDACAYHVCNVLNSRLKQTLLSANYPGDRNKYPKDYTFYGAVRPDCLLSAMYYMLYSDIVRGRIIKKCNNATCFEYFTSTDYRKEYCSHECADKQGKKDRRKLIREENIKQGVIPKRGRPRKDNNRK